MCARAARHVVRFEAPAARHHASKLTRSVVHVLLASYRDLCAKSFDLSSRRKAACGRRAARTPPQGGAAARSSSKRHAQPRMGGMIQSCIGGDSVVCVVAEPKSALKEGGEAARDHARERGIYMICAPVCSCNRPSLHERARWERTKIRHQTRRQGVSGGWAHPLCGGLGRNKKRALARGRGSRARGPDREMSVCCCGVCRRTASEDSAALHACVCMFASSLRGTSFANWS